MKFNLQMFKGKGGSTVNYTPSEEERALLAQQLKYQNAFYPNVIMLNDTAKNLLDDSYGTVQVDYNKANADAQQQIANAQGIVSGLQSGQIPEAYVQNMTDAISRGVNNTVGNAINSLGNRGVLNSSITNKALGDISNSVSDTMAQQYNNSIGTMSQLAGQQVDQATAGITASAGAQEASQQPALNLWNASLGLQGSGNQVLGNIAGKYGTRVQQNNGGGFGNFLGGVATGLANNGGFWNYLGGKK
jgi:hypothetical protein